jgi:hypothetical protein
MLPLQSTKYASNAIIEINKQSEKELFKEVYKLANYFKEELNYDSVPFCPYGNLRENYKALLFTEQAYDEFVTEPMPYRIYGACNTLAFKSLQKNPVAGYLNGFGFIHFLETEGILKKIGIN